MSRDQHEFQFTATEIADAAGRQAAHHLGRHDYWQTEYDTSLARVRETARIEIRELPVTNGTRTDVSVDYGDLIAYRRMMEAQDKRQIHARLAEEFKSAERVYGTQGVRVYDLTTADVFYFGLNEVHGE
jgi:hypothetical protein